MLYQWFMENLKKIAFHCSKFEHRVINRLLTIINLLILTRKGGAEWTIILLIGQKIVLLGSI